MQSSSTISEKMLSPHEYIRDTMSFRYQDCVFCGNRTEFTCIKCGYCYSCHWKIEQAEEIELRDNLKDLYASMSKRSNDDNQNQKLQLQQQGGKDLEKGLEKWGTVDVLGRPAEPICTYYRCNHKFSIHGSRSCRCKHPTNKTLGVKVRYL
jgi:ferredoxin